MSDPHKEAQLAVDLVLQQMLTKLCALVIAHNELVHHTIEQLLNDDGTGRCLQALETRALAEDAQCQLNKLTIEAQVALKAIRKGHSGGGSW